MKRFKKDPNGDGFKGFVHNVVIEQFLSKHPAPEELNCILRCADDESIGNKNGR
ncbi:MAG: hypothetical protein R2766_04930 [Saprospiraceae bacterium]